MQTLLRLLLIAVAAQFALPVRASEPTFDLSKLDRKIARTPKFRTAKQVYCLLALGPEAKSTVWLIIDGKRLYVDRNANGDLTEVGEQIELGDDATDEGFREFAGGSIQAAGRTHTNLTVWMLSATSGFVGLKIDGKLEQQAFPTLTNSPQTAPVLHLGGPLSFQAVDKQIVRGSKPFELQLQVGTPGQGEGSFAAVSHACVPEKLQPTGVIEFVSATEGAAPIRLPLELPGRC